MKREMKKVIRTVILVVWTLVGIGLIITIALTDKYGFSKTVIKNIVLVYALSSCILAGVNYRLNKRISGESQ